MVQRLTKSKKYSHVFSNVPIYNALMFHVAEYLGTRDIPRGSMVFIDEGAIELPNTCNLTKAQALYFILSRHAEVDFFLISQSWEDINIKIRRLYDKIYFLKRGFLLRDLTVLVEYKKKLEIDEETHQFVEGYYKTLPIPIMFRKYVWRPSWYRYFDSYDMPSVGAPIPLVIWDCELPPTLLSKIMLKVRPMDKYKGIVFPKLTKLGQKMSDNINEYHKMTECHPSSPDDEDYDHQSIPLDDNL